MSDLKITIDQLKNYLGTGLKFRYNSYDFHKAKAFLNENNKGIPFSHWTIPDDVKHQFKVVKDGTIKEIKPRKSLSVLKIGHKFPRTFYESQLGIDVKPICYRLSDLDKEIEVDGERFVPIEWFEIGDDYNKSIDYGSGNVKLVGLLKDMAKYNFIDLPYMHFGVMQKLFEWHFWPFGENYFENGLVIDKMKIQNG